VVISAVWVLSLLSSSAPLEQAADTISSSKAAETSKTLFIWRLLKRKDVFA
jgi:hypothetical protein